MTIIRIMNTVSITKLTRRRYQRGSLKQDGDHWKGRWYEDVILPSGTPTRKGDKLLSTGEVLHRIRREEILARVKDCPGKRLAQRLLDERLQEINGYDCRPGSTITFERFAKKWKEMIMVHHKPSSRSSQKSLIDVHLVPAFGPFQLKDIQLEMIQEFVNGSSKSPKTVKNIIAIMMVMWDMAMAWGYVRHNPFPRGINGRLLLRMPRIPRSKTYSFTLEETLAIIDKAQGKWKTFFRILAETGMRPGEVAGLRRDAIGDRWLSITQSVWSQKVQTPKSDAAVRRFAISSSLAGELSALIASTPDNDYGLVFVTEEKRDTSLDDVRVRDLRKKGLSFARISALTGIPKQSCQRAYRRTMKSQRQGGKPLSIDTFRNRVLNPILDELGIRAKVKGLGINRCGMYPLRRMNGTLMDHLAVPLKTRQKRLGHADAETTLRHYTHPIDADDVAVAEQMCITKPGQQGRGNSIRLVFQVYAQFPDYLTPGASREREAARMVASGTLLVC